MLVGGAGNDAIDGGAQDDLIFGDNVYARRARYRRLHEPALPDALRHAALQPHRPCEPVQAPRRAPTTAARCSSNGIAATPTATPIDAPWWAEYDVDEPLTTTSPTDDGTARGPAASATTTSPAAPSNDLHLRPARQRHDPGRRPHRLRRSPGSPATTSSGSHVVPRRRFRTPTGCTGAVGNLVCDPIGALIDLAVGRGAPPTARTTSRATAATTSSSAASARTTSSAAAPTSSA